MVDAVEGEQFDVVCLQLLQTLQHVLAEHLRVAVRPDFGLSSGAGGGEEEEEEEEVEEEEEEEQQQQGP